MFATGARAQWAPNRATARAAAKCATRRITAAATRQPTTTAFAAAATTTAAASAVVVVVAAAAAVVPHKKTRVSVYGREERLPDVLRGRRRGERERERDSRREKSKLRDDRGDHVNEGGGRPSPPNVGPASRAFRSEKADRLFGGRFTKKKKIINKQTIKAKS